VGLGKNELECTVTPRICGTYSEARLLYNYITYNII